MDRYSDEELEAVQAVVDRVSSWQETAPEGTVEEELQRGLHAAGVDLPGDRVTRLADAIEEKGGDASAADVLA